MPRSQAGPRTSLSSLELELSTGQFFFPFIHEWPVDGASPEVRHMRVRAETGDGGIEESIILAKDGTVRREEEFDVGCADPLEALDEIERFDPWWASMTPTHPSRKMLSPENRRWPIRIASWPAV